MATGLKYEDEKKYQSFFKDGTDIYDLFNLANLAVNKPDAAIGIANTKFKNLVKDVKIGDAKEIPKMIVKEYNSVLNTILKYRNITQEKTKQLYDWIMNAVSLDVDNKDKGVNVEILKLIGKFFWSDMDEVITTAPNDALVAKGQETMKSYLETLDDKITKFGQKQPQGE